MSSKPAGSGPDDHYIFSVMDSSRVSTFFISILLIVYGSFRSLAMEEEEKNKLLLLWSFKLKIEKKVLHLVCESKNILEKEFLELCCVILKLSVNEFYSTKFSEIVSN